MSDVFISYARPNEGDARVIAEALRALGYDVWRDDELPAHRLYAEVIEEELRAAKATIAIWSVDAVKSQWVRAEANVARELGTLVQLRIDGAIPPLPFNDIQCADLNGWTNGADTQGWRQVVASIAELTGAEAPSSHAMPPPAVLLPLPSKPSLAVLPFANLSADADQAYFADGMMEEIVSALTRIRSIFVIASGSTMAFRGRHVTHSEVARQLGVRYILEGNVRKSGGRVRIAVKLIDAVGGAQIWADKFDDTLEDVFALQDRVALAVAGAIEPSLWHAEMARVAKTPHDTMGAYDLYLRSLRLFSAFQQAEMDQALNLLDRGIALDPEFGPSLALAANGRRMRIEFGWSNDPAEDRARGLEFANRALWIATDDSRALAHIASALILLEGRLDRANEVIDRATAVNPGSALAWAIGAMIKAQMGDAKAAIEHADIALRLDPLSRTAQVSRASKAAALFTLRRFDEALVYLAEPVAGALELRRFATLAATYGHLGRIEEARDAAQRYRARTDRPIEAMADWHEMASARALFLEGVARIDT